MGEAESAVAEQKCQRYIYSTQTGLRFCQGRKQPCPHGRQIQTSDLVRPTAFRCGACSTGLNARGGLPSPFNALPTTPSPPPPAPPPPPASPLPASFPTYSSTPSFLCISHNCFCPLSVCCVTRHDKAPRPVSGHAICMDLT